MNAATWRPPRPQACNTVACPECLSRAGNHAQLEGQRVALGAASLPCSRKEISIACVDGLQPIGIEQLRCRYSTQRLTGQVAVGDPTFKIGNENSQWQEINQRELRLVEYYASTAARLLCRGRPAQAAALILPFIQAFGRSPAVAIFMTNGIVIRHGIFLEIRISTVQPSYGYRTYTFGAVAHRSRARQTLGFITSPAPPITPARPVKWWCPKKKGASAPIFPLGSDGP